MRVFNADGSEAEMCGNGIRCFAKYLHDRGLVEGEEARIETGAGLRTVRVFADRGKAKMLRVNMGEPRLERSQVPIEGPPGQAVNDQLAIEAPGQGTLSFHFTAVSVGNPHCVIFVDDADACPWPSTAPHRAPPPVPRRTNVEFVQVLSAGEAKMRVWERGSGETLACGTGASATCVAGVLNHKLDRRFLLHLLGGDLELEWADDGCVYLTGRPRRSSREPSSCRRAYLHAERARCPWPDAAFDTGSPSRHPKASGSWISPRWPAGESG